MKLFVLCLLCSIIFTQEVQVLPEEYRNLLDSISKDQFGSTLLADLSLKYKSTGMTQDQVNDIDNFLNQLEQMTAQEEQEENEKLQCNQEQHTTNLEDLKAQAAELQYTVTSSGSNVQTLKDQSVRFDTRIQEKQNILQEYSDIMAQLEQIRCTEKSQFEMNRDHSLGIGNVIKRSRYLIKELLPRNPVLAQQNSNAQQQEKFTQSDLLLQIQNLKDEALEQLNADEPILRIITEFTDVSNQKVIDQKNVNSILGVLQSLYDQVDSTSRKQYNTEDDRAKLHQRIKDQIEKESSIHKQTIADLQASKEQNQQLIDAQLCDQKDNQQHLDAVKQQIADIQKLKDDGKSTYNERSQARKQQLKLIRQIRNILGDYFDAAGCYISQIISN